MNVLKMILFILDSLGEQNKSKSEDNKINLIKKKDLKSGTKVVLVFKEVSNLESIMKDIPYEESKEREDDTKKGDNMNNITENDTKIKDEVTELISKSLSKLLKEETKEETNTHNLNTSDINNKLDKPEPHKLNTSDIELLNIPLGYKLLCVLFKNLKLLEDSKKLKNVLITNLLITNKMTDIYDKLKFKKKPDKGLDKLKLSTDKFIDTTGYFTGDLYDKPTEEIGKVYKTGLFHFLNLPKEIEEQNNRGMRMILKHIAELKKKSPKDLLNEDCEMNLIDKILFHNNYNKNFIDKMNVCVCNEDLCGNCIGPYQIESGKLT